jgi:hypothetical protein
MLPCSHLAGVRYTDLIWVNTVQHRSFQPAFAKPEPVARDIGFDPGADAARLLAIGGAAIQKVCSW